MQIVIKYYGRLAESVGRDTEVVQLESCTLNSFFEILNNKTPCIKNEIFAAFLNNKKIDDTNRILQDKDEICLMPPFAGG
jgi:molybdopterin converting factor small subunit